MGDLFDPSPYDSRGNIRRKSPDRRRTERNQRALAEGYHPATQLRLIYVGATCGGCAHHYVQAYTGNRYHKCAFTATRGPATDIRVGWPACTAWEPEL